MLAERSSTINDSVITGHERNYQKGETANAENIWLWLTEALSRLKGFTMPRSITGKSI